MNYYIFMVCVALISPVYAAEITPEKTVRISLLDAVQHNDIESCIKILRTYSQQMLHTYAEKHADADGNNVLHCAVKNGFDLICRLLLKRDPGLLEMLNHSGHTSLGVALSTRSWKMTELLLELGAHVKASLLIGHYPCYMGYNYPFMGTAQAREDLPKIAALLIKYGAHLSPSGMHVVNPGNDEHSEQPCLMLAGHRLFKGLLQQLRNQDAAFVDYDCNRLNRGQKNLMLRYAVIYGCTTLVCKLLAFGASPLAVCPDVAHHVATTINLTRQLTIYGFPDLKGKYRHLLTLLRKEILSRRPRYPQVYSGPQADAPGLPQEILEIMIMTYEVDELLPFLRPAEPVIC